METWFWKRLVWWWSHREFLLLGIIVGLAAFLRFQRLNTLPPGLTADEALNGLEALRILQTGSFPLFPQADLGREPLFIYLLTPSIALLGSTPLALRLVSALIGVFTILLAYLSAKEFFREQGQSAAVWAGLVTAATMAILCSHVVLSRVGYRAITLPLFEFLFFYLLLRAWRTNCQRDFVWAGLALGGSLYTYIAARFLPLLLPLFVLHQALFARSTLRRRWRGLFNLVVVSLVVILPLILYFWLYPSYFFGRASDVSILQKGDNVVSLIAVLRVHWSWALQFFGGRGDGNPHYNVPDEPLFNNLLYPLFLLGVIVALLRIRRKDAAIALTTTWLMLWPDVLSNEVPHGARLIGVIPPALLLLALAVVELQALATRFGRAWGKIVLAMILALCLTWSAASTYSKYLDMWDIEPPIPWFFQLDNVRLARYISDHAYQPIYFPQTSYASPVISYLTNQSFSRRTTFAALRQRSPEIVLPSGMAIIPYGLERETAFVLFDRDEGRQSVAYLLPSLNDDGLRALTDSLEEVGEEIRSVEGLPLARVVKVGGVDSPFVKENFTKGEANANYGDLVQLIGYSPTSFRLSPGETLTVTFYWRPLRDVDQDYVFFAQLLDFEPHAWAGDDLEPAFGLYPTSWWREGDIIPVQHNIELPTDLPAGRYNIAVGVYSRQRQKRLPTLGPDGKWTGTWVLVGPVKVTAEEQRASVENIEHPLAASLGDLIELLGYDLTVEGQPTALDSVEILPGQNLYLKLYWQGLVKMETDYTVFVHLYDGAGHLVAQTDSQPGGRRYPTSIWDVGEVVQDGHELLIPPEISPGQYHLKVGMYSLDTLQRLPAFDGQGQRLPDDAVPLGQVVVR
ncbi:MAG: ArnT family glycosyltransferase [Anaerolineae bacterium]